MAGAKVPAPLDPMVNGDDWTNILARLERTYKGYDGVSLTNWSSASTDRPQIAAGSVIEIDGAPFYYATDETIVDEAGLTDGWCYIKHVVSGDAVTPTLTNTFGTWDTAKQGFYDSGDRYSLHKMYRSGEGIKIFTLKQIVNVGNVYDDLNDGVYIDDDSSIYPGQKIRYKILSITIASGQGQESVAHGITNAVTNRRILNIEPSAQATGNVYLGWKAVSPVVIVDMRYTDTNIVLARGGTTGDTTFYLLVKYI